MSNKRQFRELLKKIPYSADIAKKYYDKKFVSNMPNESRQKIVSLLCDSKSQLRQDLFVLSCLDFKGKGYFIEVGAADGEHFSNTWLLEKKFGWDGILAEPAKVWHGAITQRRTASLEKCCVWRESGKVMPFREVADGELSALEAVAGEDFHQSSRTDFESYNVETISLADLLVKYSAPSHIDYLSIDTEGSEYDILSNFDFSAYKFNVITCEHNFTDNREKIFELLSRNGYKRVFESISRFDDWYILEE